MSEFELSQIPTELGPAVLMSDKPTMAMPEAIVETPPVAQTPAEMPVAATPAFAPADAAAVPAPLPVPNPDRPMQVLVFASQKGGAGKTTLCGQLAVQADIVGCGPVALVDTDPQGSLAAWWNARKAQTPIFVRTHCDRLADDLEELRRQGIKLAFIDTPPAVSENLQKVIACADLVVVPTRPSPHDLRAVGATLDIIEYHQKPLVFALNGAVSRARITGEVAVALSQHGTVAPVILHHRTDFASSMTDGRTVVETNPESKSAVEVADLWQYVSDRLGRLERRREQLPFDGLDRRESGKSFGFSQVPTQLAVFGRRAAE